VTRHFSCHPKCLSVNTSRFPHATLTIQLDSIFSHNVNYSCQFHHKPVTLFSRFLSKAHISLVVIKCLLLESDGNLVEAVVQLSDGLPISVVWSDFRLDTLDSFDFSDTVSK